MVLVSRKWRFHLIAKEWNAVEGTYSANRQGEANDEL